MEKKVNTVWGGYIGLKKGRIDTWESLTIIGLMAKQFIYQTY